MAVELRYKPGKETAPALGYTIALLTGVRVKLVKRDVAVPQLVLADGTTISRNVTIARYLSRTSSGPCAYPADAVAAAGIDQWIEFAALPVPDLALLDAVLASRTYLTGYNLTLADVAVYYSVGAKHMDTSAFTNVTRWCAMCNATVPWKRVLGVLGMIQRPVAGAGGAGAGAKKGGKKKGPKGKAAGAGVGAKLAGGCPPLKDAVEGQVVTRFPPEPSGYLHIGHVKAIMLNQFYAKHYKGKLLVRFDDTNPSKEKEEFEQSIMEDLRSLDVVPDMLSHTSDHFDVIFKYAVKMLLDGNAYMDDTPQQKMRDERFEGIDSVRRNESVEDNLARFHEMCTGSEEGQKWCMRAKMGMTRKNKAMRDPVMYRVNLTPHARTGTKYKAYPTYDLACPIVDSIEGVTNALRTTEYRDRLPQYYWIQDALGLRRVNVYEFSRQNFIYTTLSKRKLAWFVEQGLVEGWDDPRFPTVQGMLRRGLSVEGLRKFVLAQGASRRVIDMEWDRFWSDNKKIIDVDAKRYVAVDSACKVKLTLSNVTEAGTLEVPFHHKNPALGNKVVATGPVVWIEGDDANGLAVGQEIVLMKWNTAVVESIDKDSTGKVVGVTARYAPGGNFKKSAKLTWVCDSPDLVPFKVMEYDFLITKAKLEDGDQLKDYVNPVTCAESTLVGEPGLRNLQKGQIIQLERRGFFRVDKVFMSAAKPLTLITVPDGKQKSMSTLSTKLSHR